MAFLLHAAGFAVVTLCIMCSASATAPAPVLIEISDEELQAHSSNMADFVADAIEVGNACMCMCVCVCVWLCLYVNALEEGKNTRGKKKTLEQAQTVTKCMLSQSWAKLTRR